MGVSEKLQNFHFGVEYPFKSETKCLQCFSQAFPSVFAYLH